MRGSLISLPGNGRAGASKTGPAIQYLSSSVALISFRSWRSCGGVRRVRPPRELEKQNSPGRVMIRLLHLVVSFFFTATLDE